MVITVEKRANWTPDINGNLDLPESEQVSFSYDKPLAYKRSEWKKIVATRKKDGSLETYVDTDRARVIIMARKRTVRFDLRSASRTSPGKTPPRFVRSATIRASDIMNALLDSSSFAFMRRVR